MALAVPHTNSVGVLESHPERLFLEDALEVLCSCLGVAGPGAAVSATNSLVGCTPDDTVGSGDTMALLNRDYIVIGPNWDNGGTADVGAVTWGNGVSGTTGVVSAANSLVGGS